MTYALVDINNAYCAIESIFRPELRGKPLVVASAGDGCAIARSAEAKALGIAMGQPIFELRDYVNRFGLQIISANFALYGNLSSRMMAILREAAPTMVFSIDEAFLNCTGIRDLETFGHELRNRVRRYIGVTVSIGFARTQTLAKLSNRVAKKGAGVFVMTDQAVCDAALASFPVEDIFGVGRKWAKALHEMHITTAGQLRDTPADVILKRFGVALARTQRELQGEECIQFQEVEADRQQIMVSRSFGQRVEDVVALREAITTFAVRATEKLRAKHLVTSAVWVFANTDVHRQELRQHHPSVVVPLLFATSDTGVVLSAINAAMKTGFFRLGYAYKRAGIALMDLSRPENLQADLFGPAVQGNDTLMSAMDKINHRFGRGAIGYASTGWRETPTWAARQKNVSPSYTTRWSDLPEAQCGSPRSGVSADANLVEC